MTLQLCDSTFIKSFTKFDCAVRGLVRTHFLPFTRSGRESRTKLHLQNLWNTPPASRGFDSLLHFFLVISPLNFSNIIGG